MAADGKGMKIKAVIIILKLLFYDNNSELI